MYIFSFGSHIVQRSLTKRKSIPAEVTKVLSIYSQMFPIVILINSVLQTFHMARLNCKRHLSWFGLLVQTIIEHVFVMKWIFRCHGFNNIYQLDCHMSGTNLKICTSMPFICYRWSMFYPIITPEPIYCFWHLLNINSSVNDFSQNNGAISTVIQVSVKRILLYIFFHS